MQVRLNLLMKQQERLLRESEATVARRETIILRREAMAHSSHKQTSKGELKRITQGLQRRIQDTNKVGERAFCISAYTSSTLVSCLTLRMYVCSM